MTKHERKFAERIKSDLKDSSWLIGEKFKPSYHLIADHKELCTETDKHVGVCITYYFLGKKHRIQLTDNGSIWQGDYDTELLNDYRPPLITSTELKSLTSKVTSTLKIENISFEEPLEMFIMQPFQIKDLTTNLSHFADFIVTMVKELN